MTYDRKKFKAATIADVQKIENKVYKGGFSNDEYLKFHTVEDGENIFRIAPAFTEDGVAYQPVRYTFLTVNKPEYEDGEPTGKEIKGKKKIFCATQHLKGISKDQDPVEVYVDTVYAMAKEKYPDWKKDKVKREKFLNPLTGYYAGNKFVRGIRPASKIACYAWNSEGELGKLELNTTWFDKMKDISLKEGDDNMLSPDIFSDVDTGRPLIINKNKEGNKTEYAIAAGYPDLKKRETPDEFFQRIRLTDDQLQELEKQKPINELYTDIYTIDDYYLAIEGLKNFDKESGYGLFDDEEFIDKLQAMKPLFPKKDEQVEEEVEEEQPEAKEKTSKKEEENEEIAKLKAKLRAMQGGTSDEEDELPF